MPPRSTPPSPPTRSGNAASAAQVRNLSNLSLRLVTAGFLIAAFLLALAGQTIKLCLDAEVQTSIGDEVRGRVFSLYDTVFNVSYVVATVVAAMLVPDDGQSVAAVAPVLMAD